MGDVFKDTATALRRAVEQHGAPNRFAIGELHRLYGGPRPLDLGRLIRNGNARWAMRVVTTYLGLLVEYEQGSPSFLRVADESGRFAAQCEAEQILATVPAASEPAWCEIHQHHKWCGHNGGVMGPGGWGPPAARAGG